MKSTTIPAIICWLMLTINMSAQQYQHDTYDNHKVQLKKFEMGDRHMAYLDFGQGKPILLIHGIPTNSWLYRKMVNPLVEAGYRVIVPDMMGAGESSTSLPSEELSFDKQSSYIAQLCTHLKIQHAAMVIHDAGGPWTYNFLHMANCPVDELIFLNTIVYTEGFDPPVFPKKGSFQHRMISWVYGKKGLSKMVIKSTLKNGLDKHKLNKSEKEGYTEAMAKKGGALARNFFGSLRDMDDVTEIGRQAIKNKKLRLLSLWGQNDKILVGNQQVPLMMRDLNLAPENSILLAGCNHFVQEEVPEEICKHIDQFLQP